LATQSNWASVGAIGNTVGLLAWKNYGNSHVIFDASNSTTPNGGACNNTNASVAWSGTYPTLMGWNGGSTYGVRVDSARIADSISGQANSATITASTAANGNQIVLRDGNGDDYRRYGFANYFNMDHGVSGSTGDTIFYSSTDNYIRKNNATGLRGSLNVPTRTGGDASGTWGIDITGNAASAGTAANGLGTGQTWQSVSRAAGTWFQNTTGRTIVVIWSMQGSQNRVYVGTSTSAFITVAANNAGGAGQFEQYNVTLIVSANHYYQGTGNIQYVSELR
jgi:hypothetical protein